MSLSRGTGEGQAKVPVRTFSKYVQLVQIFEVCASSDGLPLTEVEGAADCIAELVDVVKRLLLALKEKPEAADEVKKEFMLVPNNHAAIAKASKARVFLAELLAKKEKEQEITSGWQVAGLGSLINLLLRLGNTASSAWKKRFIEFIKAADLKALQALPRQHLSKRNASNVLVREFNVDQISKDAVKALCAGGYDNKAEAAMMYEKLATLDVKGAKEDMGIDVASILDMLKEQLALALGSAEVALARLNESLKDITPKYERIVAIAATSNWIELPALVQAPPVLKSFGCWGWGWRLGALQQN